MWADAQRDCRPAEYAWRPLRNFRNSIPDTTPQSLADGHCASTVQFGWPAVTDVAAVMKPRRETR